MRRSLTIVAGAFALTSAGILSSMAFAPLSAQSKATPAKTQTATFTIPNMTCAMCPITVKKAMSKVVGVRAVTVDFGAKMATVQFDPSRTTAADIAKASANAGYPAHPMKI